MRTLTSAYTPSPPRRRQSRPPNSLSLSFLVCKAGMLISISRAAATVGIKGDHLQEASPVPAQK